MGEFGERMPCRKTFGFVRFDRPVLVRGGFRGPGFDVCEVHSPRRCSHVRVPCWVRVRVLVSVCACMCVYLFSRVRAGFVCSLQVVVEKKVERCKGSLELSDFTSNVSQQD